MSSKELSKKPNILFLITDQQTWIQNWAPEWAEKELPAMQRLLKHGLAFNHAHCNSCTCSPSRVTLFTGMYPAHHRVTQVLGFDKPQSEQQTMQQILASNFQNMGKMMESAGYQVAYKGKWHLSKPTVYLNNTDRESDPDHQIDQLYWTPADVDHIAERYRFNDWNYPDAGDDMELFNCGGGDINNDGRFVDGDGQSAWYGDAIPEKDRKKASVIEYLNTYREKHGDKPFFTVVSLVNPHDVLAFPGTGDDPLYQQAGYTDEEFEHIPVKLPATVNESLRTKPTVQTMWKAVCQANGPINDDETARRYVQFYAYLTSLVDKELLKVLDALDANGFTENTLIVRISDHGDMAMSHGMQRQKMYNVYRQSLNVPMIFSNPRLFPEPQSTNALSGLIDLMPTIATITGADTSGLQLQGRDLTPILKDPDSEVQDYVHFTYDDTYLTTPDPASMGPMHIRCIVEKDWKYAVYFDPHYGQKAEYEMYHLSEDPLETRNLAHPEYSAGFEKERQRLHERLTRIMIEKGTLPDRVIWPKISGVDPTATQDNPFPENIKNLIGQLQSNLPANRTDWNWLADTYWYCARECTPAIQKLPDNEFKWVIDQTVWHITGYRDGYFWGVASALLSRPGSDTPSAAEMKQKSNMTFYASVTPQGQVHITFIQEQDGNTSTTIGLGEMTERQNQTAFEMQMSSGSGEILTAHWAYMLQVTPEDPEWKELPGANLSVPEMLHGTEAPSVSSPKG